MNGRHPSGNTTPTAHTPGVSFGYDETYEGQGDTFRNTADQYGYSTGAHTNLSSSYGGGDPLFGSMPGDYHSGQQHIGHSDPYDLGSYDAGMTSTAAWGTGGLTALDTAAGFHSAGHQGFSPSGGYDGAGDTSLYGDPGSYPTTVWGTSIVGTQQHPQHAERWHTGPEWDAGTAWDTGGQTGWHTGQWAAEDGYHQPGSMSPGGHGDASAPHPPGYDQVSRGDGYERAAASGYPGDASHLTGNAGGYPRPWQSGEAVGWGIDDAATHGDGVYHTEPQHQYASPETQESPVRSSATGDHTGVPTADGTLAEQGGTREPDGLTEYGEDLTTSAHGQEATEDFASDGYPVDDGTPHHSALDDLEGAADDGSSSAPSRHGAGRARRRGTPRTKRSALLTVAVPSAAVMGVAAVAAASVGGLTDDNRENESTTQAAAPDGAAAITTQAAAANSKLDTQLAGLTADADDFADRASRTQERIDLKARQAAEKEKKAKEAAAKEAARPKFALPVSQHGLSAYYGQAGVNWMSVHTGIDFPINFGTSVHAVTDGTVRTQWNDAYGNMAIVTAPDGTETWYCHLSSTKVRSGSVKAGDVIAYSGSSGNSTGPHMHFEVRPGGGSAVDPLPWLRGHGLDPT